MMHHNHSGNWVADILLNAFIWSIVGFYKLIAGGICWMISLVFHKQISLNLSEFNEGLHTIALGLAIIVSVLTGIKLIRKKGERKFSKKARKK